MEFEMKDVFTFCTCVSAIIGAWFAMNYKIKKIEESYAGFKAVMYLKKGGLNIVDNKTCAARREQVQIDISAVKSDVEVAREETRRAFDELSVLNQNIITMLQHWNLKPVVYERKKPPA